jgi:hypothetical protein
MKGGLVSDCNRDSDNIEENAHSYNECEENNRRAKTKGLGDLLRRKGK